ncbi:hypothetical protein P5V15_014177 [Pogonomyrmex californicus]
MDAEITKLNTSSRMHFSSIKSQVETPKKKKLKKRNLKLQAENRMLRERIRWLQRKIEKMETQDKIRKISKNVKLFVN